MKPIRIEYDDDVLVIVEKLNEVLKEQKLKFKFDDQAHEPVEEEGA